MPRWQGGAWLSGGWRSEGQQVGSGLQGQQEANKAGGGVPQFKQAGHLLVGGGWLGRQAVRRGSCCSGSYC